MEKTRLFIIGAPKCGTTSLTRWLREHPEIHMSSIKEPHFYNTDMNNRTVTNRADYEALFADAPNGTRVLAEASTWYLYSDAAVPNILRDHPDAKFIVMTRDPVEMAVSLYLHNLYMQLEDCETLEQAWQQQQARLGGESIPRRCREIAFLQYGAACSLATLVQRLRNRAQTDQILHVPLERLKSRPRETYQDILVFAGVRDDAREGFPIHNQAKESRLPWLYRPLKIASKAKRALGLRRSFGIREMNIKPAKREPVSQQTLDMLGQYFRPERELLAELRHC